MSYSPSIPSNVLTTATMGPCYGVHICQPVAATATTVSRETDSVYDIIKKSSPSLPPPPLSPPPFMGTEIWAVNITTSSLQTLTGPEYIAAAKAAATTNTQPQRVNRCTADPLWPPWTPSLPCPGPLESPRSTPCPRTPCCPASPKTGSAPSRVGWGWVTCPGLWWEGGQGADSG